MRIKIPNIVYLVGLILGGLIFGYIADHTGRKMILLGNIFYINFFNLTLRSLIGSMWTACALSIFQLLSEDYISYVFFILFVGMAIGAVQVITVPYVIEMVIRKAKYFILNCCFLL
jgi:MFS family permease